MPSSEFIEIERLQEQRSRTMGEQSILPVLSNELTEAKIPNALPPCTHMIILVVP